MKRVEGLHVLAPDQDYAGKSLEEWAVEYVRWTYAQTACDSALLDDDGSQCNLYQEDVENPVFFLERSDYGIGPEVPKTTRTHCQVPAGKAILAPIALLALDNTDVSTPRSDAALEQLAKELKESMRNMNLKADGMAILDLQERSVGPTRIAYDVPAEPNVFSCTGSAGVAETTIEPAFVLGYAALFEPPAPGMHELEFASVFTYQQRVLSFKVTNRFVVNEPNE